MRQNIFTAGVDLSNLNQPACVTLAGFHSEVKLVTLFRLAKKGGKFAAKGLLRVCDRPLGKSGLGRSGLP